MKPSVSALVVGMAAASLAITGCSNSAEQEVSAPPSQAQTESTASSTESGTSPAASPVDDTPTSPSQSTEANPVESTTKSEADASGKPDKDDVVDGLTEFYVNEQDLSQDTAKQFAVCMVNELYPDADASTLKALQDGDPASVAENDQLLIVTAGETCAPQLN